MIGILRTTTFVLIGILILSTSANTAAATKEAVLTIKGNRFLMNGKPIDLYGIRVASATKDDAQTQHLINQLDDYQAHGVNAITVFYMGCSGGFYDPFSPDGKQIDAGYQKRMEQIIRACAEREMVVIVGIFYQRTKIGLKDANAVRQAVQAVTEKLKPYRNVILNIANEQNSPRYAPFSKVFDFREPDKIIELCQLVHEVDPQQIVGAGGYDHKKNVTIGRSKHVDVLLFDTAGPNLDSGTLYRKFVEQGVKDKPMINVETFGGWTLQWPAGVFPDEVKQAYFREVDAATAEPGLSVFFHNNPWCQGEKKMRYDLGGQGTEPDPGILWYFEYVQKKTGKGN